MIQWHRLFGLVLSDFFSNTPYSVELECDLSLRQQFLDVIIVKKRAGAIQRALPDGLDNLTTHNLLSYKSLHEPLDQWALEELIGHFVNYRKQISPHSGRRLARGQFQLYADQHPLARETHQPRFETTTHTDWGV